MELEKQLIAQQEIENANSLPVKNTILLVKCNIPI
jgi:hypothetical protein